MTMATAVHSSWRRATPSAIDLPFAMSMRWIITSPSPLSSVTIGSISGSAYDARQRSTRWNPIARARYPPTRVSVPGGMVPDVASSTLR